MTPCVLAEGKPNKHGYIRVKVDANVWMFAHRAAWEKAFGKLADDMVVHHDCGEPACINLGHLSAMTQSEHMQVHRKLWESRPCRKCGGPRTRLEPRSKGGALVRRCDACRKAAQKRADQKRRAAA